MAQLLLTAFINSNSRNAWLEYPWGHVYVRKSLRHFQGRIFKCLDLATIEVYPQYQRQGRFKGLVLSAELLVSTSRELKAVYIECVQHAFMRKHLELVGYHLASGSTESSSNHFKEVL